MVEWLLAKSSLHRTISVNSNRPTICEAQHAMPRRRKTKIPVTPGETKAVPPTQQPAPIAHRPAPPTQQPALPKQQAAPTIVHVKKSEDSREIVEHEAAHLSSDLEVKTLQLRNPSDAEDKLEKLRNETDNLQYPVRGVLWQKFRAGYHKSLSRWYQEYYSVPLQNYSSAIREKQAKDPTHHRDSNRRMRFSQREQVRFRNGLFRYNHCLDKAS